MTRLWARGAGFNTRQGLGNFLLAAASRLALGVLGALSAGIKHPEREADHSPSSSAKLNA
jgi:hypothetical protein